MISISVRSVFVRRCAILSRCVILSNVAVIVGIFDSPFNTSQWAGGVRFHMMPAAKNILIAASAEQVHLQSRVNCDVTPGDFVKSGSTCANKRKIR